MHETTYKRLSTQFKRYIVDQKHFLDPDISVQQLAVIFTTNDVYVSYVVNRMTGESFPRFISRLRLEYARHLIQTTDDRIGDIAKKCGFKYYACFARSYREFFHSTPKVDRKEQ